MNPVVISAIGSALNALGTVIAGSKQAKVEKKKVKEMKRKTFAELLNQSMERSQAGEHNSRKTQSELTAARARALQDAAAGIRQSLVR